jgi:hypothetical protein
LVSDESLIEEISSFLKSVDLFDSNLSREQSPAYHSVEYSHFSHNETLNDKQEQEDFLALIDQRLILNDIPSRMHKVQIPLEFKLMEHVESQYNHDNHVFNDYFYFLELNVSTNISFNNPIQP